jgi:hypothetical protein
MAGAGSAAATTVGQSDGSATSFFCFSAQQFNIQTSVAGGTSYVVPSNGNLTSFSSDMYTVAAGLTLQLVVVRPNTQTPGQYTVIGVSNESYSLPLGPPLMAVTTTITPIAVQAGDVIGAFYKGGTTGNTVVGCGAQGVTGDAFGISEQTPVTGQAYSGFNPAPSSLLSISANLEASSQPTELVADNLAHATSYHLRATLTSSGSPLKNQSIDFTTGSGANRRSLCSADTNKKGVATCTVSAKAPVTAINNNGSYTARFAGTDSYDASSDNASIGKAK